MIALIFLGVAGIIVGFQACSDADELSVALTYLGPQKPSSFPPQFLVQVTNGSFTSTPLLEKVKSSQLLIDGRPFERGDVPFRGPIGLPVQGAWQGCMVLDDYIPEGLTMGAHRLQLKMGKTLSKEIRVEIPAKQSPAASAPERLRQVEILKDMISPGLLRDCVENWLTEQDGGLQNPGVMHYYVDPGVKVLVHYDEAQPEPRVKGRIRTYMETRILD